jgi:hypothetical protein
MCAYWLVGCEWLHRTSVYAKVCKLIAICTASHWYSHVYDILELMILLMNSGPLKYSISSSESR